MTGRIAAIVILGAISLFFIIINWIIFWNNWIAKKKWVSEAPFIGGLLGGLTVLIIVGLDYWYLVFIPMILDWGCIPAIVRLIIVMVHEWRMSKK